MEAVRGMVWIFSGIAQCDPIHCSPRGRMGIWVREKRKGHTRKEGQEHQQECYCFLHYKHPPDEC